MAALGCATQHNARAHGGGAVRVVAGDVGVRLELAARQIATQQRVEAEGGAARVRAAQSRAVACRGAPGKARFVVVAAEALYVGLVEDNAAVIGACRRDELREAHRNGRRH